MLLGVSLYSRAPKTTAVFIFFSPFLLSTPIDHPLKHHGLPSPGALISAQIPSDIETLTVLALR